MSEIIIPSALSGNLHKSKDVVDADRLIELKKKHQGDIWPVIDEIVKLWMKKEPTKWQSIIMEISEERKNQYNEFGESSDKNSKLRRTVDMPVFVERAIRYLYPAEQLDMGSRDFWHAVWKRYPVFRVAEKL